MILFLFLISLPFQGRCDVKSGLRRSTGFESRFTIVDLSLASLGWPSPWGLGEGVSKKKKKKKKKKKTFG